MAGSGGNAGPDQSSLVPPARGWGGGRGDTAGVRPPWELGSEGKPFPKERRLWPPTWSCCHHKMVLFCGASVWVLSVRNLRAGTPGTFSTW